MTYEEMPPILLCLPLSIIMQYFIKRLQMSGTKPVVKRYIHN